MPTEKTTVFSIVGLLEAGTIDIIVRYCEESYTQRIMLYLSNRFAENLSTFHDT